MQYKKWVDIIKETDKSVIATVWTGPNYYIQIFNKEGLQAALDATYAYPNGFRSYKDVIASTSVEDMMHLCRYEDYSEELLNKEVERLLEWEAENA